MKKILFLFILLAIGLITGCNEHNESDWKLSSTFGVPYTDDQGVERSFTLRGIENKLGITDAPLTVGVSQKVVWHFWDQEDNLIGKSFKVEGISAKTGEQVTLFEWDPLVLAPNLGATTSLPSGIKLTSTGLWKLNIYLDNEHYESLFVEGKESN
ncbi:DUF4871 domain-containing protein [Paenibacillus sp. FSL R5-0407]|uniref:DUF4871 domain-containing protein n=1 Tax=Paenibacillus TaxID=44249 RepID=UPI0025B713DA|nr:DUF4871 domain-containing protein [Paenibacillus vini]MDN4071323.1 DUF4871 domain-containing protein [Paenibacillus vini]